MKFTIKTLSLYKDLNYTTNNALNTVQTEYLWKYRCAVGNKEMSPDRELFLLDGEFLGFLIKDSIEEGAKSCSSIKQGKYLFLQGLRTDNGDENTNIYKLASEELYLESLWLEKNIVNDIVFIRHLEEDGKKVFQLFREVE